MDFDYKVIYSDRKTLSLIVERDRSIVVRAPKNMSEDEIRRVVDEKRLWLFKKLRHPQKYPENPVQKEFVAGESLLYLGRNYRLEIIEKNIPGVRFQSRFYISRRNKSEAGKLFRQWYIERAQEKLPPRITHFANSMGVHYRKLRISGLKYRWASCTQKNDLIFNWRIINLTVVQSDAIR